MTEGSSLSGTTVTRSAVAALGGGIVGCGGGGGRHGGGGGRMRGPCGAAVVVSLGARGGELRFREKIAYILSILREADQYSIYCQYLESWLGAGQISIQYFSILREAMEMVVQIYYF